MDKNLFVFISFLVVYFVKYRPLVHKWDGFGSAGICWAGNIAAASGGSKFNSPYFAAILLDRHGGSSCHCSGAAISLDHTQCRWPECLVQPRFTKIGWPCSRVRPLECDFHCKYGKLFIHLVLMRNLFCKLVPALFFQIQIHKNLSQLTDAIYPANIKIPPTQAYSA